ncbi:MAG TPA: hypothetical protein VGP33_09980 [Chloroflexota bacterium]|nr:hypothetical protein [Chloroflexota bacterium]
MRRGTPVNPEGAALSRRRFLIAATLPMGTLALLAACGGTTANVAATVTAPPPTTATSAAASPQAVAPSAVGTSTSLPVSIQTVASTNVAPAATTSAVASMYSAT